MGQVHCLFCFVRGVLDSAGLWEVLLGVSRGTFLFYKM